MSMLQQKPTAGGLTQDTIANIRALRNAGNLVPGAFYQATDVNWVVAGGTANFTAMATETDALSDSGVYESPLLNSNSPWEAIMDWDNGEIVKLVDTVNENTVMAAASTQNFPFGNTSVTGNFVDTGLLNYTAGTFRDNIVTGNAVVNVISGSVLRNVFESDSSTTITSSDFRENRVESDATVVTTTTGDVDNNVFSELSNTDISGTANVDANIITTQAVVDINGGQVARNNISQASNVTVDSGDFRENVIFGDCNVTSSTTGDVENNTFGQNSNTTITGTSNIDNSEVITDANLTMNGGSVLNSTFKDLSNTTINGGVLRESTIENDADYTQNSQDNYENVIGGSTIYNQVGTGYLRYSRINGTTSWINGNTNVSNVEASTATVNTTGASGNINSSKLDRCIINGLNVPSFTIQDSTVADYAQVQVNDALRSYLYRSNVSGGGRFLISAGARVDASYCEIDSYGYIQGTAGRMTINYSSARDLGYISHQATGFNRVDRSSSQGQSNMRFLGTSDGCRIYYTTARSGAGIYHNNSTNSYIYYGHADSLGQMYTQGSTNARIYYNHSDGRGYVRSLNATNTHYIYYSSAHASGYVDILNSSGIIRMYGISASSQSIARVQNTNVNGNLYYSTFSAYYYLLATLTGGTRSGLYGMGRRSYTVTNPTTGAPYNTGAAWQNIQ